MSSATQQYKIVVPSNLTTAISVEHGPTNQHAMFSKSDASRTVSQGWIVNGNSAAGINVYFAAQTSFINSTNSTLKHDAILRLVLQSSAGPASWMIIDEKSSTDQIHNSSSASVSASSNGFGRAELSLEVTLVPNDSLETSTGNYFTTIVGTVIAN